MALRAPPGRAGRIWLLARLEIGRRGAELLERKRRTLVREQARIRAEADAAEREWRTAAAAAELWMARAILLDGPTRLELLAQHVHAEATIELEWSNLMGARLPRAWSISVPDPPALSLLGASSATILAARASGEAARAAARHAIANRAWAELAAEISRTARRLRALRDRWIPQHEAALAALDLALDESQREQAGRVRALIRWRERNR